MILIKYQYHPIFCILLAQSQGLLKACAAYSYIPPCSGLLLKLRS